MYNTHHASSARNNINPFLDLAGIATKTINGKGLIIIGLEAIKKEECYCMFRLSLTNRSDNSFSCVEHCVKENVWSSQFCEKSLSGMAHLVK